MNKPREREALRRANVEIQERTKANPDMKKEDVKKLRQRSVNKYRSEVGSVRRADRNIEISDREWEAIQAGAISETKLKDILNNTDIDKLRARATASNYTIGEIAKKTGFSTTTISKYIKGKDVV